MAVKFRDYYETLGVQRQSEQKAIRAAYRKLARKHHPDVNPGDASAEERFKEINEAHEVLSDPAKREMYDRFGEDWQRYRDAGNSTGESRSGPARPRSTDDFGAWYAGHRGAGNDSYRMEFEQGEAGGFSDFFQTLFGGTSGGRRSRVAASPRRGIRQRGEDIEVAVAVSFEEAFRGTIRNLQLQSSEICPTCNGTGFAREALCPTCDGRGVRARAKTIEVRIPAGVATGSRVRIAGQGGAGLGGGPTGDVYLRVTVEPSSRFERSGDNVRSEVEVPLYTAILGGEVIAETPTGRVALAIPTDTQPGRVFRLRSQGMPRLKGGGGERGDLLLRVRITLPSDLSDEERELFSRLQALRSEQPQ